MKYLAIAYITEGGETFTYSRETDTPDKSR